MTKGRRVRGFWKVALAAFMLGMLLATAGMAYGAPQKDPALHHKPEKEAPLQKLTLVASEAGEEHQLARPVSLGGRVAAGIRVRLASLEPQPTTGLAPASVTTPETVLPQEPAAITLTPLEWGFLEAVNYERTNMGLPPLVLDERLVAVARERSADMVGRDYFSHFTPEGTTVFDLLDSRGIYLPYAGENLARAKAEESQIIPLVTASFMESESHRNNVLASYFTFLGVGEATAPDGRLYFTFVFGGTG